MRTQQNASQAWQDSLSSATIRLHPPIATLPFCAASLSSARRLHSGSSRVRTDRATKCAWTSGVEDQRPTTLVSGVRRTITAFSSTSPCRAGRDQHAAEVLVPGPSTAGTTRRQRLDWAARLRRVRPHRCVARWELAASGAGGRTAESLREVSVLVAGVLGVFTIVGVRHATSSSGNRRAASACGGHLANVTGDWNDHLFCAERLICTSCRDHVTPFHRLDGGSVSRRVAYGWELPRALENGEPGRRTEEADMRESLSRCYYTADSFRAIAVA
jgi:hypothetical protein